MHVLIKKKEIPLESSPAKLNQNFLIWWLTFGDVLPTRAALWSHLHQRASRAAPAGGQASDPDTEGEAQHGQSRKSVTMVFTFSYLVYSICTLFLNGDNNNGNSEHWQTNIYYTEMYKFQFLWQVSMWVQLQVPKIEDGNNFGVAVQVSNCWYSVGSGVLLISLVNVGFNIFVLV